MKKRRLYILGAVLLILIFTNPSHQEFRSYLHIAPNNYINGTGRDYNFIICSIYSCGADIDKERYFGVLGNFIKL